MNKPLRRNHMTHVQLSSASNQDLQADTLVIPVSQTDKKSLNLSLDASLQTFVDKVLAGEEKFTGAKGQTLTLRGSDAAQRVVLLGVGKDKLDEKAAQSLAAPLAKKLKEEGAKNVTIDADGLDGNAVAHLASRLMLECYEFK